MKTTKYRDLIEALQKRKEDEEESGDVGKKPRAKGEAEFAAAQYPVDATGPHNTPHPSGSDGVLNARATSKTDKHDPPVPGGDRKIVKQGTSDLKDQSGFKGSQTPTRRGDKREGDIKIVRLSSSSVQEDVIVQLEEIATGSIPQNVIFEDGDSIMVKPKVAFKLMETYVRLKPENAEKFKERVNSGPSGVLAMMKFANV